MRTLPPVALACVLMLVAPAATAGDADRDASATPATSVRPATPAAPRGTVIGTDDVPQTSDGVVGRVAPPAGLASPSQRRTGPSSATRARWQVAPGVRARVWDEQTARGPIRAQLLTVDWRTPGLRLDYAGAGAVARTDTVSRIIGRDRAVAGVNGDFFDIGDTGAPLGVGRDRERGLVHGRLSGWNSAFYIGGNGRPEIGTLPVQSRILERPGIRMTNLNSPEVQAGGVGVYTAAWGPTTGYRITGGQTARVRMVLIRDGRVVRNSTTLPSGSTIKGRMLVGRDAGARSLVGLKRGTKVTVRSRPDRAPRMAITGNKFLIDDGVIQVVDDREMHPRTAIGIDRDTHRILLLVIDGRQSFSRGYTMVELADLMTELGADEALNLDGGGSSTMLARRADRMRLVNSPSDGFQRRVANAVEVLYTKPRR